MVRRCRALLATISLVACAGAANAQSAGNPLGLYVGAGLGEATPQRNFQDPYTPGFPANGQALGWDALAGIRPIRWVGAELQYLDFGHTHINPANQDEYLFGTPGPDVFYGGDQHTRAAAAFAVGYLPAPWQSPWLDIFGKVGAAQTWTSASYSVNYPNSCIPVFPAGAAYGTCPPIGQASGTYTGHETDLGYGGGLQAHFGSFAVRAEYLSFESKFGNPALLSVGVTWTP